MFTELRSDEYDVVKPFFNKLEHRLVVRAVLAENSPARMWVDDERKPSAVLLWDEANNVFYLSGDENNSQFKNQLRILLTQQIMPELRTRQRPSFRIHTTSEQWTSQLSKIFHDIALTRGMYRLYSHSGFLTIAWRTQIPSGLYVDCIDQNLLTGALRNTEFVIQEIKQMWPSLPRFLRSGFGFYLRTDSEIACWCTAEYVSKGQCGIGIETVHEHQNRGYATITGFAFVEYCLANRITPYWECSVQNLPSIRVAEKIGFRQELDYPVYFGTC